MTKPCLGCGDDALPGQSRCADCRLPRTSKPSTAHPKLRSARWTRLSKSLRKASPFCQICGATDRPLHLDHIIPASEDDKLIFDKANLRVTCAPCNQSRGNRCTDDERQSVQAAIAARKRRVTSI